VKKGGGARGKRPQSCTTEEKKEVYRGDRKNWSRPEETIRGRQKHHGDLERSGVDLPTLEEETGLGLFEFARETGLHLGEREGKT